MPPSPASRSASAGEARSARPPPELLRRCGRRASRRLPNHPPSRAPGCRRDGQLPPRRADAIAPAQDPLPSRTATSPRGPHGAKPHRLFLPSDRARYGPPPRPACPGRRAGATRNTHPSSEFLRRLGRRGADQLPPRRSAPLRCAELLPSPPASRSARRGAARPSTAPSSTGGSATAATAPSPADWLRCAPPTCCARDRSSAG
jgi:hypothetical protein